jgi:hypothetical protein
MSTLALDVKSEKKSEKPFSISHILSLPEKLTSEGDGRMSSGSREDDSISREGSNKPIDGWMLPSVQQHSDSESVQTEAGKSTI